TPGSTSSGTSTPSGTIPTTRPSSCASSAGSPAPEPTTSRTTRSTRPPTVRRCSPTASSPRPSRTCTSADAWAPTSTSTCTWRSPRRCRWSTTSCDRGWSVAESRIGPGARLRQWLIERVRRSRFLPVGVPDKRTDTDRLGRPFTGAVLVYFPNGADALYQLRPWLPALRALDAAHGVTVVFKDSRTAAIVRRESGLDCVTLARYGQLDEILAVSEVKLALYVNHDPINFEC